MTLKILDHDTQKIIYRSAVRPKKSSTPNHRIAPHGWEVSASSDPSEDKISSGSPLGSPEASPPKPKMPTVFISARDEENPSGSKPMPTFDPSDLIGSTFLLPPEENGERHRAKVTRQVVEIIDQDNGQRVKISSGSPHGYPEGSSPEQKAPTVFLRSRDEVNPSVSKPMPTFDPSDLIGRTFLLPPEEKW